VVCGGYILGGCLNGGGWLWGLVLGRCGIAEGRGVKPAMRVLWALLALVGIDLLKAK